jgi:hypothetical protein
MTYRMALFPVPALFALAGWFYVFGTLGQEGSLPMGYSRWPWG